MADIGSLPFEPVCIESSHIGSHRNVGSVREAAECLVSGWPEEGRGRAYRLALRACHDALEGGIGAETARIAFIRAAQEVGNFVSEGRRKR